MRVTLKSQEKQSQSPNNKPTDFSFLQGPQAFGKPPDRLKLGEMEQLQASALRAGMSRNESFALMRS